MSESRRARRENQRSRVTFKKLTFHKLDWLEYITIGLAIWFFFFPQPYKVLFTVLMVIPIIGVLLNGIHGRPSIASLGKFEKDKHGQDEYDVADFIDVAAWIILIRVLLDFEVESFYSLIIPGTISFILILIVLFVTHSAIEKSQKSKWWIYFSLIGSIFLYSYAGTYGINCVYDDSQPQVYEATVVDKRTHRSRKGHRTYYLKITPWGHHYDKEEVKVPLEQYSETEIGETVKVDLKEGLFNIPWYYIERKNASTF